MGQGLFIWLNSVVLHEMLQVREASSKAEVGGGRAGQGWVGYEEARASGQNIFRLLTK